MEILVKELAKEYSVLVFDGESIKGYNFENVIKLDNCSIRNAFALASGCDAIIAPDSSFVHFAASQDIPCIALFGPIDGKIRTKYYKYCRFIDARSQMECLPCWRNENIPCKLTNMRSSVCMSKINLNTILDELKNIIAQRGADENFK
jgi:ADP-heptose:LPS heptosyltransferase